jgi:hypothetical protein
VGSSRRRLESALLCTVAIGLASPSASAVAGQGRLSCRSGLTLFRHGSLRVETDEHTESDGLSAPVFYECSSRAGRPHVFFAGSEGASTFADSFRLFGARLGFHIHIEGGTAEDDYLGWINTRTNTVRYREAFLECEPLTYAIASDGAIAGIACDGDQLRVYLIPYNQPSRDRPSSSGRRASLGQEKTLLETAAGGLDPHFIQVTTSAVTWKTSQGTLTSVARA